MVSTKSALVACMLLLSTFASARDMDDNTGYVTKVEHNSENGEFDIWRAPASTPTAVVEKRDPLPAHSYFSYDPKLVSILHSKKQWDFCKAYVNLRPTVTKTVTVTTCGYGRKCSPTTITTVVSVTFATTATVTGVTSTVTIESVSTSMATVTTTVPNPTVTSTVGTPLTNTVLQQRYVRPPSYLNRYQPAQISAACSQLVKHIIQTKTNTQTRTVSGKVKTATQTMTRSVTNTILTTSIPFDTITNVVATTTLTTTETSTTISTVCPTPLVPGAVGISVTPPGNLQGVNAADEVGCCSACYDSPTGCAAWWWHTLGVCFIAHRPGSNPTTRCPLGLGTAEIMTGGVPDEGSGGRGPCYDGEL